MKKKAFNIVQDNDGFTYKCVTLLESECGITRPLLQQFIPCYGNALGDSSHLDRYGPVWLASSKVTTNNEDIARIETNAHIKVVNKLTTYQLKPEGMVGLDLIAHMIGFWELNSNGTDGSKFTISGSAHLDLSISLENIEVLKNTNRLLVGDNIESKRLIFKDATGV